MSVTLREWLGLSPEARSVVLDGFLERLGDELVPSRRGMGHEGALVPQFVHRASGMMFHLVPGDTATLGMSRRRFERVTGVWREITRGKYAGDNLPSPVPSWDDVAQLTPTREVSVPPALVGEALSPYQLHRLGVPEAYLAPAGLRPEGVSAVQRGLERAGWRLPSEAEWEFTCRAAVDSLDDLAPPLAPASRFLVSIGERPELCRDSWHDTWSGAPRDATSWGEGHAVVRGGGGGSRFTSYDDPPAWAEAVWPRRCRLDEVPGSVVVRPWISL